MLSLSSQREAPNEKEVSSAQPETVQASASPRKLKDNIPDIREIVSKIIPPSTIPIDITSTIDETQTRSVPPIQPMYPGVMLGQELYGSSGEFERVKKAFSKEIKRIINKKSPNLEEPEEYQTLLQLRSDMEKLNNEKQAELIRLDLAANAANKTPSRNGSFLKLGFRKVPDRAPEKASETKRDLEEGNQFLQELRTQPVDERIKEVKTALQIIENSKEMRVYESLLQLDLFTDQLVETILPGLESAKETTIPSKYYGAASAMIGSLSGEINRLEKEGKSYLDWKIDRKLCPKTILKLVTPASDIPSVTYYEIYSALLNFLEQTKLSLEENLPHLLEPYICKEINLKSICEILGTRNIAATMQDFVVCFAALYARYPTSEGLDDTARDKFTFKRHVEILDTVLDKNASQSKASLTDKVRALEWKETRHSLSSEQRLSTASSRSRTTSSISRKSDGSRASSATEKGIEQAAGNHWDSIVMAAQSAREKRATSNTSRKQIGVSNLEVTSNISEESKSQEALPSGELHTVSTLKAMFEKLGKN